MQCKPRPRRPQAKIPRKKTRCSGHRIKCSSFWSGIANAGRRFLPLNGWWSCCYLDWSAPGFGTRGEGGGGHGGRFIQVATAVDGTVSSCFRQHAAVFSSSLCCSWHSLHIQPDQQHDATDMSGGMMMNREMFGTRFGAVAKLCCAPETLVLYILRQAEQCHRRLKKAVTCQLAVFAQSLHPGVTTLLCRCEAVEGHVCWSERFRIHWREPKPNLGNFVFALETLPKGFRLVGLGR